MASSAERFSPAIVDGEPPWPIEFICFVSFGLSSAYAKKPEVITKSKVSTAALVLLIFIMAKYHC